MLYLNGTPLDVTRFPDGTSQVWKLPETLIADLVFFKKAKVKWEFASEAEYLHLAQLKTLLRSFGVVPTLELTYLPYGRQDKPISNTSTFALRTFATLLNFLEFQSITCMDPHSDEAVNFIIDFKAIYPIKEVQKVMEITKSELVCYPDKGARSKYEPIYDYPFIYGEKVREPLTGNIINYQLIGDPSGKNVLIVDDICDGGMTFKLLAKDLLAAGAKEVNLFITHGIFSKGLRTLTDSGIKRVFTQDGEAYRYQDQIMYRRIS